MLILNSKTNIKNMLGHTYSNYTPNSTTTFSRQKSSDIKDIKYIKRTNSKQNRPPSSEVQKFHQFKKRNNLQIDNRRLVNNNSKTSQIKQKEKQNSKSKKGKQKNDSFFSSQKNQSYKQNREQNSYNYIKENMKNKYEKQEYLSKKEQNLTKLMKFGQISNKNKASNFSSQQIPVYISSRSNNNQSSCGSSSINTKSQQNFYLKKHLKNQIQNQDSSFICKLHSLILNIQEKDKFNSSKFQKNLSNFNAYNSQHNTEKMYEKIKIFIQQKQDLMNEVYQIVNQINTLNISSPYTFSNKNLIKILNDLKKSITQLSQTKRKCQDFNKTLLIKARQCQNLKQSKTKQNQQIFKLKQEIRTLSQKNDEFLSKQMANSQKMSELQYHLMIAKKELQENKKYEKCNRETLDLQQQLKILGYQNNDQQRQIIQLNEKNTKLMEQNKKLETLLLQSALEYQQFSKKLNQNQNINPMIENFNSTKQTQVSLMSQSERDTLEQKIKIQEEFQELCVEKLNLQAKIYQLQNKFKQKKKSNNQKDKKIRLKLQELRQKLEDVECQNNSIRKDISRFFQEAFQVMVENLEKAFFQNYCEVSDTNNDNNGYEKIYYQTNAFFMDQANQCKIQEIQCKIDQKYIESSSVLINENTKQNQELYLKIKEDLQQKNLQINELKQKVLSLQNLLQQNVHSFQLQSKRLQNTLIQTNRKVSDDLNVKIKRLQQQKQTLQQKNKQILVQNSKNMNQNQRYIQDLMTQLKESQQKNKKLEKQFSFSLASKQKQINILKQELQCYRLQNQKRARRLMRISSFIIQEKIYNTSEPLSQLLPQSFSQKVHQKLNNQQETISVLIQNKKSAKVKVVFDIQTQTLQTQTNKIQQSTIQNQVQVDLSKKEQQQNFHSQNSQISQRKIITNNEHHIQQTFEIKKLDSNIKNDKNEELSNYQKPTKTDTFISYLQKFRKNTSSSKIQKYLIDAMIKPKNENKQQRPHKMQQMQKKNEQNKMILNKELLQNGKKLIRDKIDNITSQKFQIQIQHNKGLLKSKQKNVNMNINLMRSVNHNAYYKNEDNSQKEKDDSEFDLCI